MFTNTAKYYDLIYSFRDYADEAARIAALIRKEHSSPHSILDVGCATAEHVRLLSREFAVDGIDLEPQFVEIAQLKVPQGHFSVADMRSFELGKKYDVVQCLFSSIGYLKHGKDVIDALRCFSNHLAEKGIIIVEPWFTPDAWQVGVPHMAPPVNLPEIKICRMNVTGRKGNISLWRFHYLIATPDGVQYICEDHELALYTVDEMLDFFARAELRASHDPKGFSGRGVYVARRKHP